jgi:hypothetical protein
LDQTWTGLAGVAIPALSVAGVAKVLFEHLRTAPLPELAAVQTIRATHAVDQPVRAPEFPDKDGTDPSPLMVYRVKDDVTARLALIARLQASDPNGKPPPSPSGDPGDTGILLTGEVRFDRETSRQLELLAFCAFPNTLVFDDPLRRGRTPTQQLTGFWPKKLGSDDPNGWLSAAKLFGFGVASDGRVELPQDQVVTLRQFDDLGARDPKSGFVALDPLDLVAAQRDTLLKSLRAPADAKPGESSAKLTRSLPFDPINDTLARKLTLQLRATTRFDPLFRRVIPDDTLLAEDFYLPVAAKDSKDAALTKGSERPVTLWIPSTKRPAKPKVHAVLPSFHEVRGTFNTSDGIAGRSLSKVPRLRVILDRPWFSSGEGERLALVLWPPRLREIDPQRLAAGEVPRDLSTAEAAGAFHDAMILNDFTDENLGPGGRFVTRWGADPIRESHGPAGPFLPKSALEDFAPNLDNSESEDAPHYVAYRSVPIMDDEQDQDDKKQQDKSKEQSASEPKILQLLPAALATYVPRFDVESEKWFVDVALAPDQMVEPFVRLGLARYQPHAHPELHVSAPVAVWAQVLPQRTIHVWVEAGERSDVLHVQINGAYAGRVGGGQDVVYPVVHVTVQQMKPTGAGLYSESVARTVDSGAAEAFVQLGSPSRVLPCPQEKAWYRTFTLPKAKAPGPRGLAVLIEELEEFMSTDDVNAADVAAAAGAPPPTASGQVVGTACEQPPQTAANAVVPGAPIKSGPRLLARIEIE